MGGFLGFLEKSVPFCTFYKYYRCTPKHVLNTLVQNNVRQAGHLPSSSGEDNTWKAAAKLFFEVLDHMHFTGGAAGLFQRQEEMQIACAGSGVTRTLFKSRCLSKLGSYGRYLEAYRFPVRSSFPSYRDVAQTVYLFLQHRAQGLCDKSTRTSLQLPASDEAPISTLHVVSLPHAPSLPVLTICFHLFLFPFAVRAFPFRSLLPFSFFLPASYFSF